jgi:small subunit ribosomal protein S9
LANETYIHSVGRRKCAIAQVKLFKGIGEITVNGKKYRDLFPTVNHRDKIEKPMIATDTMGKYNFVIKVTGGGVTGQADAICHGIARALVASNEAFRLPLRAQGLLTRDPRIKERKKYGLKRARKAPQYTKR